MRALLVLFCSLTLVFAAHAQSYTWGFALGGAEDDVVQGMAVDAYGHLYVAAVLNNVTQDMDPGAGVEELLCVSSVLACYTVEGDYRWAYAFDGGGFQQAQVAAAPNGDVVIAGRWASNGDLDPGPGVVGPDASGIGDMVVARYDSTGNYLWSFNFGTGSSGTLAGLALDAVGNVYISGVTYGGSDFDPGPGVNMPFPDDSTPHNFLAKYDANGALLWARMLRGPSYFSAPVIAVDSAGNAYLSGSVGDSLNLDPGFTNTVIHSVAPIEDVYLARYRPDGTLHWGGVIGGALDGYTRAIHANAVGRVVVAGTFRGYYDFDMSGVTTNLMATIPGAYDAFVAVYDSTSALQWAKRFGNSGLDVATAVRINGQGEVTLAGYYAGSITIGSLINGHGSDDAFLTRLDANGNVQWAFGIGGTEYDRASAVAISDDGSTFLGGYLHFTIDLDPGTGIASYTAVGGNDLFVARYDGFTTGVSSPSLPLLRATPNPTAGQLRIHVNEVHNAQLIDATGHVIRTLRLIAGTNVLDLTAEADGMYLLRCGASTVRVVKQR